MKRPSVISRLVDTVRLEMSAIHYPRRSAWASFRSAPSRSAAIARGQRRIEWLGVPFEFESRFEPILLHAQQSLVCRLDRLGILPTRGSILDVGANVGQFGTAVRAVRPDLDVVSLEPNPQCQDILRRNAARHDRWSVLPVGLGESDGQITLWFVSGRSAQGSVFKENASLSMLGNAEVALQEARVDVISGSTLARRLPDGFTLVKVDVEGFEATVLPEVAKCKWEYLLVELGGTRAGALSRSAAAAVLEENGAPVEHITDFGASDEVHDVLFRRLV